MLDYVICFYIYFHFAVESLSSLVLLSEKIKINIFVEMAVGDAVNLRFRGLIFSYLDFFVMLKQPNPSQLNNGNKYADLWLEINLCFSFYTI